MNATTPSTRRARPALLLAACLAAWPARPAGATAPAPAPIPAPVPAPATPAPAFSADVQYLQAWVRARGDNHGRPYAIVDKRGAALHLFAADGRPLGSAPALLGQAVGDTGVPGIGARPLAQIRPHERTTPAGRYDSQPGRHLSGEAVVWIDYAAALSIHRLRPAPATQRRPQRLLSAGAEDNRISLGCVIVAGGFFDDAVLPVLGRGRGVVYVLPEAAPVQALFAPAVEPRQSAQR